ncbi:MAG: ACT domain-containing protein [Candidatus Aenigmarchaeota archaeon]|nr:ACT domain-containing protein [Candidatus Aenigmarchaeota archaeon]
MSIAEEVRLYIKNKPYVKEALEKGIVNLSALTRQIQKELGIKNFEAIKAALRRLSQDIRKTKHKREEKVLQLLKKSKTTMYDGDAVLITDKPINVEDKLRVNLGNVWVYLLEKDKLPRQTDHILRKTENCTTILINSPEDIEKVPGIVAYLTSLLAEQNVNIFEFISCWCYTIIVVERKDALRAYEVLSEVVG